MMRLGNYALGEWQAGTGSATALYDAVTGDVVAEASSSGLDFKAMLAYARDVGGPKLRAMTFHERARMLKAIATALTAKKDAFYELSYRTGATKSDSWIDIDGGFGTFFVYASKGRKEFPNESFYVDGPTEALSKNGTFVGRHVMVPLEGVGVHINAFNFPVWGMMEKLAPCLLAGVPAIVKPATATSFLTEAVFREMIATGLLPAGAVQLVCGSAGDLLDHLTCQDVVAFTGSADTGRKLKAHPAIVANAVRFNMEADSLNCSILGPDALPGTPEFELFIKEVVREMTAKAGQKCTAIRRSIVPEGTQEAVLAALKERLEKTVIGDPRREDVRMGPLASRAQVRDVGAAVDRIRKAAELVYGDLGGMTVLGADAEKGAFFPKMLLHCAEPLRTAEAHDVEAFGPVNTVMPYRTLDDAVTIARRGQGSLVGSLFTADPSVARKVVFGIGPYHGRLVVLDRSSAKESTGHGSPMPHLVHGGPGRAGGGEEMGGKRGVMHYLQRVAIQGSPDVIAAVTNEWTTGATRSTAAVHPFRRWFDEVQIGESLVTHRRTVTEADVVNFAGISGDFFYAHMDDVAAKASLFERRVAHGYFVLSAAAGLFVDPAPGPVMLNYGLEGLRFTKPVYPGDTIQATLTCKQKIAKDVPADQPPQGVVHWDVEVRNQDAELCATYTILTLVRRKPVEG
ncbi:MAG: phenylacetic acid degradation bifunctional protein PaaZ [Gemmatimonadaceae bacterium]|nr:phenylacetic acid degradation bifunctional protein PaaZ [Gemmatimonadaceae bacterium]